MDNSLELNNNVPLIKVEHNENGTQTISARELYTYLGIKADFTTWCKKMFEYGFVENLDYSLHKIVERSAHNKIDYALTLDCAKEIAMIQRSEKGKQARQYFIACEQKLKANLPSLVPATNMALFLQMEQINVNSQAILKRLLDVENNVDRVLFTTDEVFDEVARKSKDYYSVQGWFLTVMNSGLICTQEEHEEEKKLLEDASHSFQPKMGNDPKFGMQMMYHVTAFESVYKDFIEEKKKDVCSEKDFFLLRDFCQEDPMLAAHGRHNFNLEIEELTLIGKKISHIPPAIKYLKKLKYLILADNEMDYVPEELSLLPNLVHLDLSYNFISVLSESLGNLEKHEFNLDLSENPVKFVPKSLFSFLESHLIGSENVHQYIKKYRNRK